MPTEVFQLQKCLDVYIIMDTFDLLIHVEIIYFVCYVALKELADSSIPHVKAAADGALWKIEGETAHLQKQSTREQHTSECF